MRICICFIYHTNGRIANATSSIHICRVCGSRSAFLFVLCTQTRAQATQRQNHFHNRSQHLYPIIPGVYAANTPCIRLFMSAPVCVCLLCIRVHNFRDAIICVFQFQVFFLRQRYDTRKDCFGMISNIRA